eukprot:12923376-Prorocentrum_lima.AAC.1
MGRGGARKRQVKTGEAEGEVEGWKRDNPRNGASISAIGALRLLGQPATSVVIESPTMQQMQLSKS